MYKLTFTILTWLFMFVNYKLTIKHEKVTKYIALGDSYTICTDASSKESWHVILTAHLNEAGIKTELVANPSVNGYSTVDLIEKELPVFDKSDANFVTILIGVNDWVRGADKNSFTKYLQFILDHVQNKLTDKSKIVLIIIPDFWVTPQCKNYGNGRDISKGIEEFNTIIKNEGAKRGLPVVDIF